MLWLALTGAGQRALAYNSEGSTAGPLHWVGDPVVYHFVTGNYSGSNYRTLLDSAVAAWTGESALAISRGGDVSNVAGDFDGCNVVKFATTTDDDYLLAGANSVTIIYSDEDNVILDADMILKPTTNDGVAREAMHEVGHFLGLTHSAVLSSAMYPLTVADYPLNYDTAKDKLDLDREDHAAMSALYPLIGDVRVNSAKITGRVTVNRSGVDVPVYGANVVAVNSMTGLVQGSALTKGVNQGGQAGCYEIAGLPGGYYLVYAEPVDGPLSQADWPGNYAAGSYWGGTFTKNYRTTFHDTDTDFSVMAIVGQTATHVDIKMQAEDLDKEPQRLNITGASFSATASTAKPQPIVLRCGQKSQPIYLYGKAGTKFNQGYGATLTILDRPLLDPYRRVQPSGSVTFGVDANNVPYAKLTVKTAVVSYHTDKLFKGAHSIVIKTQTSAPGLSPVTYDYAVYTGGLLVIDGVKSQSDSVWMKYE